MSKGSGRRPTDQGKYSAGWDRVFNIPADEIQVMVDCRREALKVDEARYGDK